jgi:hypothetical protein
VTDLPSISGNYAVSFYSVFDRVNAFFNDEGDIENLVDAVRAYYENSDFLTVDLTEPSADADRFASTGDRAKLFGAAVGDLLIFRSIGLLDFWAALRESGAAVGDDLTPFQDFLGTELGARDNFQIYVLPRVSGGEGPYQPAAQLGTVVQEKVGYIAGESTSNVLSAVLGTLGGLVPANTPGHVVRTLHRFGRALHLDKLLDWAQRLLNLALDKLHRIFAPDFEPVLEPVKELLEGIIKVRDRLADRIFQLPRLTSQYQKAITTIRDTEAEAQVGARLTTVVAVADRFNTWNLGFDVATVSLKWGWRISAISPPIALALASLRVALGAGAFLIGQYHLDSPELGFLPWDSKGVLTALQ